MCSEKFYIIIVVILILINVFFEIVHFYLLSSFLQHSFCLIYLMKFTI